MTRKLVPAAILASIVMTSLSAHAEETEQKFRREVDQKYPGGRVLKMSFEETARDEKTSTAKAVVVAGAALPAKVFMLRSAYQLAIERKCTHFIKLADIKEEDGSTTYKVGFTNDPAVDVVAYFQLEKPLPNEPGYQMQSVKDLEVMFKEG